MGRARPWWAPLVGVCALLAVSPAAGDDTAGPEGPPGPAGLLRIETSREFEVGPRYFEVVTSARLALPLSDDLELSGGPLIHSGSGEYASSRLFSGSPATGGFFPATARRVDYSLGLDWSRSFGRWETGLGLCLAAAGRAAGGQRAAMLTEAASAEYRLGGRFSLFGEFWNDPSGIAHQGAARGVGRRRRALGALLPEATLGARYHFREGEALSFGISRAAAGELRAIATVTARF